MAKGAVAPPYVSHLPLSRRNPVHHLLLRLSSQWIEPKRLRSESTSGIVPRPYIVVLWALRDNLAAVQLRRRDVAVVAFQPRSPAHIPKTRRAAQLSPIATHPSAPDILIGLISYGRCTAAQSEMRRWCLPSCQHDSPLGMVEAVAPFRSFRPEKLENAVTLCFTCILGRWQDLPHPAAPRQPGTRYRRTCFQNPRHTFDLFWSPRSLGCAGRGRSTRLLSENGNTVGVAEGDDFLQGAASPDVNRALLTKLQVRAEILLFIREAKC